MNLKKIIISLFLINLFSGCAQNIAFLGPAITAASTGSAYQASLSYGSGKVMNKITGKTMVENIQNLLSQNNAEKETDENVDVSFKTIKK